MEKKNKGSLLGQWKHRQKGKGPQRIEKMPEGVTMPLSFGEQRLWFLQQLYPENPFYNYSESFLIKGQIDKTNLKKAFHLVYQEQEVLRSSYHLIEGKPERRLKPEAAFYIHELDFTNKSQEVLNEYMALDASKPFNLTEDQLIRVSFIKLDENQHLIFLTLNHIVGDKWSMGIFWQRFTEFYSNLNNGVAPNLKRTEIQYHDYAFWQQGETSANNQLEYWTSKLSGKIPKLDLPKDFRPPMKPTFKGVFKTEKLSKELSKQVLEMCAEFKVTPYVFLITVYYIMLYRYTGQKDILIGSPISNRDQTVLEDLMGFFNETVVLRTELSDEITFKLLLEQVKITTIEAFENKDVPFDVLVKTLKPERSLNLNPFFQVMFLYDKEQASPKFGSELDVTHEVLDNKVSKFDLTLSFSESEGQLTSNFEYATDLFHEKTIARMQDHVILLLAGVTHNPNQAISNISMLTDEEKNLFFGSPASNDLTDSSKSLHSIITDTALLNENKTALVFGAKTMTYGELNKRADIVARAILENKKESNEIIGLCVERSNEMIVGLLGIIKAGCAYLPIDPDFPAERIDLVLNDAKVRLVVTNNEDGATIEERGFQILKMNELTETTDIAYAEFPVVKPDDIAYVIYTSGSTGKPKGVPISHKNIVNSTLSRTEFYKNDPSSFLLMSSISFDSSKAGIFWTLCKGGTLVISEKRLEQDVELLVSTLKENKVSHTLMLPTLYNTLLDFGDLIELKDLSTVIVAGEACSTHLCEKHFSTFSEVGLYNEYGPTEASVWCIAHKIEKTDLGTAIPIGRPVANAKIYVLNEHLKHVPYGAAGELYIGGVGLSGGYVNRAAVDTNPFIDLSFSKNRSNRIYRTGDMVRYDVQGNLQFLGRKDQQVKIRGFRIEIEEIEKVIESFEGVDKTVVLVCENKSTDDLDKIELQELLTVARSKLGNDELHKIVASIENMNDEEQHFLLEKLN